MKVAFLDRDGTIVKDYPDKVWRNISTPEFIEGSLNALKEIQARGYQIIVITNQYIINEKVITMAQYNNYTNYFLKSLEDNEIKVLDIFFCPHARGAGCNCIKPESGMIDQAVEKYPDIDLERSFIVGDSVSDVMLGSRVGIRAFGINLNTDLCNYVHIESLEDLIKYI